MKKSIEGRNRTIQKIWDEAWAYCTKPYPGSCALCGDQGVVLPFMKFADGREEPYREGLSGGILIGHLICGCCSHEGCQHKSARWLQYDAVSRTLSLNKPKDAAKTHGLSLEGVGRVIAWELSDRPDFSAFHDPFAYWMSPQQARQTTAALYAQLGQRRGQTA